MALFALAAACSDPGPPRATLSVGEAMAGDTGGYERATEPRAIVFPADHGPHPAFRTEWWYFTGNLTAGDGRDFGFQLTFFRTALRPDTSTVGSPWATRQAYMGHFALTDMAGARFHAFERFDRGALGLAGAEGEPMRVWVGDWRAESSSSSGPGSGSASSSGSDSRRRSRWGGPEFYVQAAEGGVAIDLSLTAVKPVVLQGDDGLSRKGPEPGNASYYYSLTRLEATGTVTVEGSPTPVRGLAWLDREWSTSALSPGLVGWDWFALQLDEGTELMVYRLREDDGGTARFSAGTFVRGDGSVVRLGADDFTLDETGSWSSPRGGSYPSGWRVRVPSLDLDLAVRPRLDDQELDLAFRYWEGAVAVTGRRAGAEVAGRGYVELTGYGDDPRPRGAR
ncbi:MAG: lipocalin-like domain-containing protein [Longimicrobiales bacterium]